MCKNICLCLIIPTVFLLPFHESICKLHCAVDSTPSQIPTLHANVANSVTKGRTDGWKNNVALAHTYQVEKSCSKFG